MQALVCFESPAEARLAREQLSISLKGRPIDIYQHSWKQNRFGQGQMDTCACSMKGLILEQKYLVDCEALLDFVTLENYPDYKEQVGQVLREYIPESDDPKVA